MNMVDKEIKVQKALGTYLPLKWEERRKLYAGTKRKRDELRTEGHKLRTEGNSLRDEVNTLFVEARRLYR